MREPGLDPWKWLRAQRPKAPTVGGARVAEEGGAWGGARVLVESEMRFPDWQPGSWQRPWEEESA